MAETVAFVGGGRIVRILLAGWMRAGNSFAEVRVSDPDSNAIARLQTQFSGLPIRAGILANVAKSPLVFLAVHPPVLEKVCRELAASLSAETIVVSLAPKITLSRLRDWLGGDFALARVIPNAGSYLGQGYNPVCFGPTVNQQQRERILALLRPLGIAPVVEERFLEAYAIVTAMGPTYFWPQLYELRSFLNQVGISDDAAKVALDAMLRGTIAVMFENGLSENEVMDLIPVKPLADIEASLRESYRTKLRELWEKLRSQ
ncbi:MAG: pyrroline-5-carboxylate reductase family protein [Thermogutta sp.]